MLSKNVLAKTRSRCVLKISYTLNAIIVCLDIDDCSPNPCANGGTCADMINDYNCNCAPGFTGKNCTVGKLTLFPIQPRKEGGRLGTERKDPQ